jgi:hypothetical protein
MAVKSYTEQLEEVQAAISAIETNGQQYQIAGGSTSRMLTRADLGKLYKREEYLRMKVSRESRGGARVRGITKA